MIGISTKELGMLKNKLDKYISYKGEGGEILRLNANGGRSVKASAISFNTGGRPMVGVCKRSYSAAQISWIWAHGDLPSKQLIHIDGDFNNYHIDNLMLREPVRGELTQEYLKGLLHYDPDTGIFKYIRSPQYSISFGDIAGSKQLSGYLSININGKSYRLHRLAWLYMTGSFPKEQIDHINHKRDDNRWCNLREVTKKDNARNMAMQKRNTSGFCGVWLDKRSMKWVADIFTGKDKKHLGRFIDKNDAIKARKEANLFYGFHENHGEST